MNTSGYGTRRYIRILIVSGILAASICTGAAQPEGHFFGLGPQSRLGLGRRQMVAFEGLMPARLRLLLVIHLNFNQYLLNLAF